MKVVLSRECTVCVSSEEENKEIREIKGIREFREMKVFHYVH